MNQFKEKFDDRFLNLKIYLKTINEDEVYRYVIHLEKQVAKLVDKSSNHDFWVIFPKILSIDSKLSLLEEFTEMDMRCFCRGNEVIQMIEKDYRTYNKENFGYRINEQCPNSIIFFTE